MILRRETRSRKSTTHSKKRWKQLKNISTDLQDEQNLSLLIDFIRNDAETINKIHDISTTIQKAKGSAPPIDFSHCEAGPASIFSASCLAPATGWEEQTTRNVGKAAQDRILRSVKQEILPKVRKEVCFETKFNALHTLSRIADFITHTDDNELADFSRRGPVPAVIAKAMLDIGDMLSDEEIQRIAAEKDMLARVEAAASFRPGWYSDEPFLSLTYFTGLFIDGSIPLDFSQCVKDVEESLARELVLVEGVHHYFNIPEYTIRMCVSNRIAAKISRRSCYATKLNALRVLTKIGQRIISSRLRPHYSDFGKLDLENLVTDTMLEICKLEIKSPFRARDQ